MSGVYVKDSRLGIVHAGAGDLEQRMRLGDGVFSGDPRLDLMMREVRKGALTGRRYEVWRHNEDGSYTMVGHWRLEEYDRILLDLATMRAESPGHVPVTESIDRANAVIEAHNSKVFRDSYGEALDHGARLFHERTQGKTRFRQVGGLGGKRKKPRKRRTAVN